ncbi:MAG: VacJ family lipoprotein [Burkholderiales bacterium]
MVLLIAALTGCATTANNPKDPLEGFNRAMFNVNDKVDQVALKPAATVYKKVLPEFVQTGVGNFFGNIGDVSTALNNFLQARVNDGMSDVARVMVNSIFGLGGLFDVASPRGLVKHDQDFGQTLGRWGVKSGPYLVLPFIGPTTTRDGVAMVVDLETDLWSYKYPVKWRNTGSVIRVVDRRAYILDSTTLLEDAALDKYEFVRDAYLQRRETKIYKGKQDSYSSDPAPSAADDKTDVTPTPAAADDKPDATPAPAATGEKTGPKPTP